MAKAGVFISVVGKNDPKAFEAARAELRGLEAEARKSSGGISGSLSAASSKLDSIGSKLMGVGKKMTLGVTLPIVGGFALAAKAAATEDQKIAQLEQTLRRNTGATKEQISAVEAWITKVQNATGISRDQLEPALQKLVIANHSVSLSQREIGIATDIAAARGKPLNVVIDAMVKATNGQVGALGRLGIATKQSVTGGATLAVAQASVRTAMVAAGTAIEKHGKDSVQAQAATAKLAAAQDKLTKVQEGGTKQTLTFDQILKKASDTMGGQAARAADTSAGRLKIMQVKFHDLVVEIGNRVLPIGEKLLGWIGSAISAFTKIPGPIQDAALVFLALAAAIGPIVTVAGAFATALGAILSPVGLIVAAIVIVVAGLVVLYLKWNEIWAAMKANPALIALALTVGSFLIPIFALVAGVHWLASNWREVWAAIQQAIQAVQPIVATVVGFISSKLDQIGAWAQKNEQTWNDAWSNISTVVSTIVGVITTVLTFLVNNVLHPAFDWWLSVAVPVVMQAWATISAVISAAILIVEGIVQTVMALIGGDWGKAWQGILTVLTGIWDLIKALVGGAIGYILIILGAAWGAALTGVQTGWGLILTFFGNVPGWIFGALAGLVGLLLSLGSAALHGMLAGAQAGWGAVSGWVAGIPGMVLGALGSLGSTLLSAGGDLIHGLEQGISNAWGSVIDFLKKKVGGIVGQVANWLGLGSPSKYTRYHGQMFVEGLRLGMQDKLGALTETAKQVAGAALDAFGVPTVGLSAGKQAAFAALPARGSPGGYAGAGAGGGAQIITVHLHPGAVVVDARGATNPAAVGDAVGDAVTTKSIRELTKMKRSA